MIKKKYFVLTIMILVLFFLTGCAKTKYNVKIVDGDYTFKEGVLDNYLPYGAFDDKSNSYINDRSTPEDFTLVIKNQNQLNELFTNFPTVNFEKEMIIVYIYTGIYNAEKKITDVEYEEKELSIEFGYKLKMGTGSATIPMQRTLIIKMNKIDAYEIDIDED
jgi:hypothetical protein